MSKEVKVLVIVEGTRTEPKFFDQLASVYGVNAKIYSVGTNIYLLYKKMQEYEFQCDVKDALSELTVTKADKELLKETFTYTYLIFDCDAHHTDFLTKISLLKRSSRKISDIFRKWLPTLQTKQIHPSENCTSIIR